MPTRWIPYVKVVVHLVCLLPFLQMVEMYRSGALGLMADPVNWITHQTGYWALFLLLVSLAVTPVRRLHAKLSNLIRFRRLLGLYAFFYATLHLATYVFLFSGYDLPTAWMGLKSGHIGAVSDQWKLVWPTMLDDLKKRRFIQVGLLAWFLLFLLALTSPALVMRKMGGKNWQRLHRWVYVAGVAGVIHYWWLVKKGVMAPLPFTLVLGALLLARVGWSWRNRRRKAAARPVAVSRVVAP
ncbi:MAG TPA: protein-methionine-sulfoxide reductase heme-binding subunit MsrQ [Acidobacteriaceae bacterium]|nr:protein-methionine-sulfoxide reductase heme-binding subunit MsrQ [Acidobacteriaceae bacterium]